MQSIGMSAKVGLWQPLAASTISHAGTVQMPQPPLLTTARTAMHNTGMDTSARPCHRQDLLLGAAQRLCAQVRSTQNTATNETAWEVPQTSDSADTRMSYESMVAELQDVYHTDDQGGMAFWEKARALRYGRDGPVPARPLSIEQQDTQHVQATRGV